jgi:hypothetical protein
MVLRVVLVLVSLALLVHGTEGLYVALHSSELEEVSCEEFHEIGVSGSWVRITGCELDYLNVGYRDGSSAPWQRFLPTSGQRISELLFPVRPRGADSDTPVKLIVSTRDPVVLALAERTVAGNGAKDQESFLVTMLQVVTAMRASREIDGMLRGPLEVLRGRGSIQAIHSARADDVAVLDLHAKPSTWIPAAEVGASLLTLVLVFRWRRRSPMVHDVSRVSGPRLMLLNLGPGATTHDIEFAPPLGSQDEVRSLIVLSLPGISFDDSGRGIFTVRAGSVEIDLRVDDPVYTAVVTVRGYATPAVARLLDETGWQAFAPNPGVFVTSHDLRPSERG